MTPRERVGVGVLVSASAFTLLPMSAIAPLLSTIAANLGGGGDGALKAQSIITLFGIGMMVGGPISGWIGDRIGVRRMLLTMLFVYGIAGSAGLYLADLPTLLASRVVLGVAAAGIASASYVMIAARYDDARRGRMLGYQMVVISIVGVVSLLVAGLLARDIGWRAPFAIYLVAFAALGAACLATFPEPARRAKAQLDGATVAALWKLWPLYLMLVPLYIATRMFTLQLSFVLAGDGIASPVTQSRIMTALLATTFVSGVAYGRLHERLGSRWTLVLILTVMAASDILLGVTRGIGPTIVACMLAGLAGAAIVPYVIGAVLGRAAPEVQGRAVGFMYTAMFIGDFANPLVINPLRAAVGNHGAFTVVGVVLLCAAIICAVRKEKA